MEGVEVKRRPDGTRYVQPYLGRSRVTGRAIRPYKSFPADMTDAEVEDAARRWFATVGAAAQLGAAARVGELLDVYVDSLEATGAPANTVHAYRSWAHSYALPLSNVAPWDVTPWMLSRLYMELAQYGAADGGELSSTTVRSLAWFLSGAFRWMRTMGLCDDNPCDHVPTPRPADPKARALDDAEQAALLSQLSTELAADPKTRAEASRLCSAFLMWLALGTGVRVGEACALRRGDVSGASMLVEGTVTEVAGVSRQPFTKGRHPRRVALDEGMVRSVRGHLAWQDSWLSAPGAAGSPLATPSGSWMRPSELRRQARRIFAACGLPADVHFHTLRHTHATALLVDGMDPKTVSERLGHADVATTMRIYSHVLPGRDQAAAGKAAARREQLLGLGG